MALTRLERRLELRPDLDRIDALAPERDALWSRLEKTTFLTPDEKRTAIGYAPLGEPTPARKFRPDQPRDNQGRWAREGGDGNAGCEGIGADANQGDDEFAPIQLAQLGGATSMTDTGLRLMSSMGGTLIAPEGETLRVFTVSPFTNNVYARPVVGEVDVTGWSAYYGSPGSIYDFGDRALRLEGGGILFIHPRNGQSIFRRVFPGS